MKRILLGVSLVLLTGTVYAQPAGVTVTLSASPANSVTVGSPVVLTATVRTPGVSLSPGAPAPIRRDRLRYTFKAQKNWPCPSAATLAENVSATSGSASPTAVTHVSTFVWTPAAAQAGEYTLSVDVTYISSLGTVGGPLVVTRIPERGRSPRLNYKATPTKGWSLNVKSDFYPASPATAPVSGTLNLSFYSPPEFRWYRWKIYCTTGCSPSPPSKDHQGLTTSFQFSIPKPGSYIFSADIDRVVQYQGQSDCTWEQTTSMPHLTPPYYYVNRAP
jgi:hypothetical protein